MTKKYFRKDSDLIEYIDLKDKLDSNYLKLNRNGFSDQGYEHLEKVYHAIVQTGRKALQHFGKKENGFTEKMKVKVAEILEKESSMQEKMTKEKEEFILSVTALVYFAMVVEKEEYCIETKENDTEWMSILQDMQKKLIAFHSKSTLFNMKIWVKDEAGFYRPNESVSIVDIIDNRRKYVIVSKRNNDSKKVWKHYLMEEEKIHEEVKKRVQKLKYCVDWKERRQISEELEKHVQPILCANFQSDAPIPMNENEKEQIILKWILNNVPTMALYSSDDGNTRINILDVEIMDAVFLNYNMKQFTINRILENDKYERFSTVVWSGYQALSLKNVRKSIKFVKRGKLSQIGYGTMLLPISMQELKEVIETYEKRIEEEEKEIKDLYTIFKDIFEKIVSKSKDADEIGQIRERYWSRIKTTLQEVKENSVLDDKPVEEKKEVKLTEQEYELLRKKFLPSLDYATEANDDPNIKQADSIWEEKIAPKVWELKMLIDNYFPTISDGINRTKMDETKMDEINLYKKFLTSASYKNLKKYVLENAKIPLQDSQIDALYDCLIHEIVDAVVYSRWKRLSKIVYDNEQAIYKFFNLTTSVLDIKSE